MQAGERGSASHLLTARGTTLPPRALTGCREIFTLRDHTWVFMFWFFPFALFSFILLNSRHWLILVKPTLTANSLKHSESTHVASDKPKRWFARTREKNKRGRERESITDTQAWRILKKDEANWNGRRGLRSRDSLRQVVSGCINGLVGITDAVLAIPYFSVSNEFINWGKTHGY